MISIIWMNSVAWYKISHSLSDLKSWIAVGLFFADKFRCLEYDYNRISVYILGNTGTRWENVSERWKIDDWRVCRYIEVDYFRTKDKQTVHRKLQPVAIMFSEYYFYLTAFIPDEEVRKDFDVLNDSFPTIYRIDRIKSLKVLDERFYWINCAG